MNETAYLSKIGFGQFETHQKGSALIQTKRDSENLCLWIWLCINVYIILALLFLYLHLHLAEAFIQSDLQVRYKASEIAKSGRRR